MRCRRRPLGLRGVTGWAADGEHAGMVGAQAAGHGGSPADGDLKKTASRGSQSDGAPPVGCTRARPSDSSTSLPSKKGVAASVVEA